MSKPVSDKQLAANRANAAQSTGPRSHEGKARSAQNARKDCRRHRRTEATGPFAGLPSAREPQPIPERGKRSLQGFA
jgi:hypothetical protein